MRILFVPAGVAFLGIMPLPIDAYHLIRWVVSGFCVYAILSTRQSRVTFPIHFIPLAVLAALYNPIFPFYFSRGIWVVNDLVAGAYLVWLATRNTQSSSGNRRVERNSSDTDGAREQQLGATPQVIPPRFADLENRVDKLAKSLALGAVLALILIVVFNAVVTD
ncbi:MAG: hypothetical protein KGZ70_05350 [Hydrogenophaga sp.]|nr:hypothetical protein [Hydrogenophaga sp.]